MPKREYTRYAIQEIIEPFEFERLVPEIFLNLDQDPAFQDRKYPDIRRIGGYKDEGHDAISITWEVEEEYSKTVFAFSKRKDWEMKIKEDLEKRREDERTKRFVFVTSEKVGKYKLPEHTNVFVKEYGFPIEIIDIDDIVLWLDNTTWGELLKIKYGIGDGIFYLNPIDKILISEEKKEKYFRLSGPILIDFEKDIIFKRKEVEKIISNIKLHKIHVISGDPASGKSVLVRNICYQLRNSYQIFYLNIEDLVRDPKEVYTELKNVNQNNTLIILEDAHKYLNDVERLVLHVNKDTTKLKLIITTRTQENDQIKFFEKISELLAHPDNLTRINAFDICSDLITFYLEKMDIKKTLSFGNIHEYCDDLWLLGYALKTLKEKGKFNQDAIYKEILGDLESYNEQFGIGASDVILIISLITSKPTLIYETDFEHNYIPIDDFFLIDKLEYDPGLLQKLVHNGVIRKIDGHSYWCWHTSLSHLYVEVAQKYPTLLSRINSKFKELLGDSFDKEEELYFNINVFHAYLRIHPEYVDKILSIISTSTKPFGILDLLEDDETQDLIFSQLEKGTLEQINSLLYVIQNLKIASTREDWYSWLIETFGPNEIKQKIEQCSNGSAIISYSALFNLMEKQEITIEILDRYIDKIIDYFKSSDVDLYALSLDLGFINDVSNVIAKKIAFNIQEVIKEKIKVFPLWMLSFYYNTIKKIDNVFTIEQLNENWELIKGKFLEEKESPVDDLLTALTTIFTFDPPKEKEIIDLIEKKYVFARIDAIDDVYDFKYLDTEQMDPSLRERLLSRVTSYLESEISEKGIVPLRDTIAGLHKENYKLTKEVLSRMDCKIIEDMKTHVTDYDFLLEDLDYS